MERKSNREHIHIAYFNPDVTSLERAHQDFLLEMQLFHAGQGYENFNDFVCMDAVEYKEDGDGVTYIVWNVEYDENGTEKKRDMVSFYTLAATAIPYEDRIMLDEEEAEEYGREFDSVVGFKSVFLHSLPDAEKFYMANGFHPVKINMQPLHSFDSEFTAMYLTLKEVYMNYDK